LIVVRFMNSLVHLPIYQTLLTVSDTVSISVIGRLCWEAPAQFGPSGTVERRV